MKSAFGVDQVLGAPSTCAGYADAKPAKAIDLFDQIAVLARRPCRLICLNFIEPDIAAGIPYEIVFFEAAVIHRICG